MESDQLGPGELKSHQIINDEFVEGLQEERLPPQRRSIQAFPLLVAQGLFDDPNAEFRGLVVHPVVRLSKSWKNRSTACFSSSQAIFRPSRMDCAYSRTSGQFFALVLFNAGKHSGQTGPLLLLHDVSGHFPVAAGGHAKFPPVREGGLVQIIPQHKQGVLDRVGGPALVGMRNHRTAPSSSNSSLVQSRAPGWRPGPQSPPHRCQYRSPLPLIV